MIHPFSLSAMNDIQDQEFFVLKSTSSSFKSALDIPMDKGYTHVAVLSACVPKTYYVLPNDASLTVVQNGNYVYVTIPAGVYSVLSFPSLFTSAINNTVGISPWAYNV